MHRGRAASIVGLVGALAALVFALPAVAGARTPAPRPDSLGHTTVPLTVQLAGNGTGSVTDTNSDFECPTVCSYDYDAGAQVVLTATADVGSQFAGWSGAGCTGTGSCIVTMSAAQTVTATFNEIPPTPMETLKVQLAGSGTGSVTDTNNDFLCSTQCSTQYDQGAEAELVATPDPGSTFAGWSGSCSGRGSCIVTMSADQTVGAVFLQPGHGTVRVGPPPRGHHRLRVRIRSTWRWSASRSVLERLRFTGLPHRARIAIRCHGHRCPFTTRRGAARHLKRLLHTVDGRAFGPGDVVTITISARHRRTERAVIVVRRERRPVAHLKG